MSDTIVHNDNVNHAPDRYGKLINALYERAKAEGQEGVELQLLFRYGVTMKGQVRRNEHDDTLWTMSSLAQMENNAAVMKVNCHFHTEDILRVDEPLGKADEVTSRIVPATMMPGRGRGPLGG